MKAPGCPGPISIEIGSRQEKPSVWTRIGAERIDGMGSVEMTAVDGLCVGWAPGPVQAATNAIKARPAILMRVQRTAPGGRYCQTMNANGLLNDRRGLSIALRLSAVSPGVLAVLMYFVTPSYFRPMFESIVGWLLVCVLATAICVGYLLVEAGIWWFRKGRVAPGVLVLVGYLLTWLVAVWIVVLGPAALILMKPRS
jgi:hypothetical protein